MPDKSYKLTEVFGTWRDPHAPTYVDRANLDQELQMWLDSDEDIVIHGGSQQGKTVLRRRVMDSKLTVEYNCVHGASAADVFDALLRSSGSKTTTHELNESRDAGQETNISGGVEGKVFGVGGKAGGGKSKSSGRSRNVISRPTGDMESMSFRLEQLANILGGSGRRLVLDDFHFLEPDVQRKVAEHLKTLQENGVFAVVVGVWEDKQLLVQRASQIRSVDIDLRWSPTDLEQVIDLGCEALNINVSPDIKRSVIQDSHSSISVVQNLMQAICIETGVIQTAQDPVNIAGEDILDRARDRLIDGKFSQYGHFFRQIAHNERQREGSLRLYERIMRACVEQATPTQLLQGIRSAELVEWIRPHEARVNSSNITQTLQRINGLQDKRDISDIVFYFDDHVLKLVDRNLLFYIEHNKNPYPWDQEQDD